MDMLELVAAVIVSTVAEQVVRMCDDACGIKVDSGYCPPHSKRIADWQ